MRYHAAPASFSLLALQPSNFKCGSTPDSLLQQLSMLQIRSTKQELHNPPRRTAGHSFTIQHAHAPMQSTCACDSSEPTSAASPICTAPHPPGDDSMDAFITILINVEISYSCTTTTAESAAAVCSSHAGIAWCLCCCAPALRQTECFGSRLRCSCDREQQHLERIALSVANAHSQHACIRATRAVCGFVYVRSEYVPLRHSSIGSVPPTLT